MKFLAAFSNFKILWNNPPKGSIFGIICFFIIFSHINEIGNPDLRLKTKANISLKAGVPLHHEEASEMRRMQLVSM